MKLTLLGPLAALVLTACGGGDESPTGAPIPKAECPGQLVGGQVATGGLVTGGESGARNVADGSYASFATLAGGGSNVGAASATASQLQVLVTARRGLSFPAGTRAGALAQLAPGAAVQQAVSVDTYLGETLQETFDGGTTAGSSAAPAAKVYSYPTTKAYDAVRFTVRLSGAAAGEQPQIKVYEICG